MEKKNLLENIALGMVFLFAAVGIYVNGNSNQSKLIGDYNKEKETIDSTYSAGIDSLNRLHNCRIDSLNRKYKDKGMLGLSHDFLLEKPQQ